MNRLLLILGLLFSVVGLQAQTFDQFVEAAEKAYKAKHYAGAYEYYGVAIQFDSSRTDLWYKRGLSAQGYTAYGKAIENYNWVLRAPERDTFSLLLFKMAQANQSLGNYEEAVNFYERFLERTDIPEDIEAQARKGLSDSEWSQERIEEARDIAVSHLPEGINSPYSDFGFTKVGDTIYYSSNRNNYERDTIIPVRNLSRIYRKVGTQDSEVVDGILEEKIKKSNRHTAYSVFNNARNRVYFTICDFEGATDEIRCEIYYSSTTNAEGKWSNSQRLNINAAGYNNTMPHLSVDPETGSEVIYFASNRPDGMGGLDLYSAPINADGTAGEVKNLGDNINTTGDEVTPYFDARYRTLYFSSDGPQTLGGLDIFSSRWSRDGFREPDHLGSPINSSFNDRGFTIIPDEEKAYFNSNRQDSVAIYWTEEREACCDDIYFVDEPGIKSRALTFDERSREELNGTTVSLVEIRPNGEEVIIDIQTHPNDNHFDFKIEEGKQYKLRATKEGYSEDIDIFDLNSPEFAGQREIERRLYLGRGIKLDVFTFRSLDQSELEGCNVSLYKRTPDGRELVESVDNPTGNDFHFYVDYGEFYEIDGQRPGFGPAFETVDLTGTDLPTGTIRRDLYLPQLLIVNVFDVQTREPLDSARVQLLAPETEQRPAYADVTNNESNRFEFGVDLGQPYRIIAERESYFPGQFNLIFSEDDIDDSGTITFNVYLRRPTLPISLFFDNDHPNPRTLATTTNLEFVETNEAYFARKDDFIASFTEGMSQNEAFITRGQYNDFFNREIKEKGDALDNFARSVLQLLEQGDRYTISMVGFASPRAKSGYNLNLTKRRLDAVTNYFERFQNKALLPYIQSGALKFDADPRGERPEALAEGISDEINDPRNSIFSLKASAERRVDIIELKAQE